MSEKTPPPGVEFGPDDAAEERMRVRLVELEQRVVAAENSTTSPAKPRCTASISNALGERYECIHVPGHGPAVDKSGVLHDHASIEPNMPQAHSSVYWNDSDPGAASDLPQRDPVNDASSWIGKAFGGLGGPELKLTALNPQPVRVRFVDLPSQREVRQIVAGIPANVVTPGGFALVVDRFRDQAHRDRERVLWQDFGATIGAKTLILYVGQLDIEPVDWE